MKKINQNNVKKLKALLKKGEALPYRKVANNFAKVAVDEKLADDHECNQYIREALDKFGEYLENKKAIIPLKIDVIDFALQNQELNPRALQMYFAVCLEFVIFCQDYYWGLFDGILVDTGVSRNANFIKGSIITKDKVVFAKEER